MRHWDGDAISKRYAEGQAIRQLHPIHDHIVDCRQRVVVDVTEFVATIRAPSFERAAGEQFRELVEVGEDERLRLVGGAPTTSRRILGRR